MGAETMGPAEVLAEVRRFETDVYGRNTTRRWAISCLRERLEPMVAALIEREAALVAERDALAARHAATERDACVQAERANALAKRVKALEADAARWADIARRFDSAATGRSERILEGLAYPHEQPWLPLAEIVDAARAATAKPQGGAE